MKFEQLKEPFDRAGMWILKRFPGILCGKQAKKLEETLKILTTTQKKTTLEEYYGKKFSRMFMLLFFGGLALSVLALRFTGEVKWLENPVVVRPDYGEGNLETELEAAVEDGESVSVPVTIGERKYSREEIQKLFTEIAGELEETILGENTSLEEVRQDLVLPAGFQNGVISAQWEMEPYGYLDQTGHLIEEIPEEGVLGVLTVVLKYEKEEYIEELPIRLMPKERSFLEQQAMLLKNLVEAANGENPEEEEVKLPTELDGEAVRWGSRPISPLGVGVFLLAVGLWYLYGKDDREMAKEEKYRKQQMIMDYPVILYKMSMLLGAGMTIQGAFSKIAYHYKNQPEKEVRYAYEEMLLACYEMQKGIGEAAAYENFGQKCRDLRYLKFGSLLSQNLKKGSKGLSELLEKEARDGMEERKNLARKLGEEAGTKLLLPMMLMLVLVMVILMVPALISF